MENTKPNPEIFLGLCREIREKSTIIIQRLFDEGNTHFEIIRIIYDLRVMADTGLFDPYTLENHPEIIARIAGQQAKNRSDCHNYSSGGQDDI